MNGLPKDFKPFELNGHSKEIDKEVLSTLMKLLDRVGKSFLIMTVYLTISGVAAPIFLALYLLK